MKRRSYRALFERDTSGAWLARVPAIRGCHTYGRTLEEARRRLREALSLWVDDADTAELEEKVRLSAEIRRSIRQHEASRRRVQHERAKAQASTAQATRILVRRFGFSLRDAGELLGLSHQRVQQLLKKPSAATKAPR